MLMSKIPKKQIHFYFLVSVGFHSCSSDFCVFGTFYCAENANELIVDIICSQDDIVFLQRGCIFTSVWCLGALVIQDYMNQISEFEMIKDQLQSFCGCIFSLLLLLACSLSVLQLKESEGFTSSPSPLVICGHTSVYFQPSLFVKSIFHPLSCFL